MKKETTDMLNRQVQQSNNNDKSLPGYPSYPESEDIYKIYQEEKNINPEDIRRMKESNEKYRASRSTDKGFNDESPDGDLDVPGSELDDDMETIGSEDEENNYYSLGGDDHDNLDENQGE
jgi:hypothetical protein